MLFTLCGKRNIQRGLHFMDKINSFHVLSQHFEKRILVSSCLSVRRKQLSFHCTDFHKILYWSIFRKSVEKIQVSLISDKNNGYFTWRPMYTYDHISLSPSQNEKCFGQNCRENQNIHFKSNNFFLENHTVYEITWKKYGRVEQAMDDNKAHAHYMQDTWTYKHTLRIGNNYFSTTTMVVRTCLDNVIHTLPVLLP
jgi:hypothetical protein